MISFKPITKTFNHLILQFNKIYHLSMLWLSSEHKWMNMNELINKNLLSDRETLLYLKKIQKLALLEMVIVN